jgi:hypothetical protein
MGDPADRCGAVAFRKYIYDPRGRSAAAVAAATATAGNDERESQGYELSRISGLILVWGNHFRRNPVAPVVCRAMFVSELYGLKMHIHSDLARQP